MEIVITGLWILASGIVGIVLIALTIGALIAIVAPFVWVGQKISDRLTYEKRRAIEKKGEIVAAVVMIGLLVMICVLFGMIGFDVSNDTFGWPDIPGWMDADTKK